MKELFKCTSCDTISEIVILESNFDDEDIHIEFCPICSVSREDVIDYEDDEES